MAEPAVNRPEPGSGPLSTPAAGDPPESPIPPRPARPTSETADRSGTTRNGAARDIEVRGTDDGDGAEPGGDTSTESRPRRRRGSRGGRNRNRSSAERASAN